MRRLRATLLGVALVAACGQSGAPGTTKSLESEGWPEWDAFARNFIEPDGRIVDRTFDAKSTSEGQSYGLFFALAAGDRGRFDAILRWTDAKLAQGRLGDVLPAWWWGRADDGSWGVRDENPASDADLFIAYSLLEAARLWNEPRYAATGRKLLAQIQAQEVVQAGAAGPVLLPGPVGFVLDGGDRYRIDPSYLPGFQFRYFATVDPAGPWQAIWDGYVAMARKLFVSGVAPDLFVVDRQGNVAHDSETQPSGSYDAIRVYLWAGMSGAGSQPLLTLLAPFAKLTRDLGRPPEKVVGSPGTELEFAL